MDAIATVAVTSAAAYLLDKSAEGLLNEIGKTIWDKLKAIFNRGNGQLTIEQFGADPANVALRNSLETRLDMLLEFDPTLRAELETLLNRLGEVQRLEILSIGQSKNVISRSEITAGGNVNVGDNINKQINMGDHSTYNETNNG